MHRIPLLALCVALAVGCASSPTATRFRPTHDPRVSLFWSDRETIWNQFRLGGGLNVVVANPQLPAAPQWRFSGAGSGTSASPVVVGTSVLVPANDRRLYALDAATGRPFWIWRADNELMSSPVYQNGITIVGAGDAINAVWAPPVYTIVGLGRSHLDGLDLRHGTPVWRFNLAGNGMPSPAIAGGTLIEFDGSGVVKALDAQTGRFRWRRLLYSVGTMSNVLLGDAGTFYISGLWPNAVYALRARDGSTIWRHRFSDYFNAVSDAPLARSRGRIVSMYLVPISSKPHVVAEWMQRAQQHVYALDERNGRTIWDTQPPNVRGVIPPFNESAIPLIVGSTVYDGSAIAPFVTAFHLSSGRVKWQHRVGGAVKSGLVDRDGVLYFGDIGGILWAIDDRTGRAIGSIATDLSFNVGSPIILNDSLVIGSSNGPVIAVPLAAIRASRTIDGVTMAASTNPIAWIGGIALVLAMLVLVYLASDPRRPRGRRA